MDFENNDKKQEETSQDGFQKEFRPGRSPRPRIHTAARPAYERPNNYRSNDNDEGGFRPEGFGAGLQSSAPQQHGGYRPRNNYNNNGEGYQPRQSYGQRPQQGGYGQRPQGGYGQRPQQGGYGQRPQGLTPYDKHAATLQQDGNCGQDVYFLVLCLERQV